MSNNPVTNDDALFEELAKTKKRKKKKTIITVVSIVLVAAIAITFGVSYLQRKVRSRFNGELTDIKSYAASVDTISTTVTGNGTLSAVGSEQITVLDGIEIVEVLVEAGDAIEEGDPIAVLDMTSVMNVLAGKQAELDDLDSKIEEAASDSVANYLKAGVSGRVKLIYAASGDSVIDCMTEHGALAVISLDGCMAVDIDTVLDSRQSVTVTTSAGKKYPGTAVSTTLGRSTVTITDDGPLCGDIVEVSDAEGKVLGSGELYIHNPLSVTGYAGTINQVIAYENMSVYPASFVFSLKDTKFSANYDALVRSRNEAEKDFRQLIEYLRTGTVTAPFSASVSSVDYSEDGSSASAGASAASVSSAYSSSALAAYASASTAAASSASSASRKDGTALVTLAPMAEASVSIAVDEKNILSLKLGQEADVTISALGENVYQGRVTEVNRVSSGTAGITSYTAVITFDRTPAMLTGMKANAEIKIEGTKNAIIVPVDAVHNTKAISYVYTSYDPETKQYGGMVEVTTGVSNSKFIEITSGLEEGTVVWYRERQTNDFFAMMAGLNGGRGRTTSRRSAESTGFGG